MIKCHGRLLFADGAYMPAFIIDLIVSSSIFSPVYFLMLRLDNNPSKSSILFSFDAK
jgi:hypothetical protein